MEFRIALSHVARGLEVTRPLVVARHPSETLEHVTLRVLAWSVLYEEGLEPGPGLCDGEAPDVIARDAGGDVTAWVACGRVPWEKLRKALSQNARARVSAFFSGPRRAEELEGEIRALPRVPKEIGRVESWMIASSLVEALAKDARRQSWTVTVIDEHVYVDADGTSHDGALVKMSLV